MVSAHSTSYNVDMISAVFVNGSRYNPNQITSKVKIDPDDLQAGDNEILVVISSANLGQSASGNAYDTGLEAVTFVSENKVQ